MPVFLFSFYTYPFFLSLLIYSIIEHCFFLQIAKVANEALNKFFPPRRNVRIIAEPGRYFVASAFSLTVNVIAKRMVCRDIETGKIAFIQFLLLFIFITFKYPTKIKNLQHK